MIDNEELGKIVTRELDAAEMWQDGDLAEQQASNLRYYHREQFGNEVDGFSKVVTADVMETVEGIMPDLMKIFASGDNVVEFEPQNFEDVPAAEQATDYVNHVFMNRMDGFKIFYDWFKDSLLMKNGIVDVGWEEKDTIEFHDFKNITQEEIDLLEDEDSVEYIDVEETEDEGFFDIRVKRVIKGGKPYVETVPAEEFYIRERSKSIADSDFHCSVTERPIGELIELGYKEEDLMPLSSTAGSARDTQVEDARFSDPEEGTTLSKAIGDNDEDRLVKIIKAFVRVYDEEYKCMKLIRVLQCGHTVLDSEEVNRSSFISLSPIMMPHKFTGISVADLVRDVQEINSALWRQMLDNLTLANSGRYAAVEGQVNLKDLLDNKIGGVVRMKAQGAVQQLPTPNLSPFTVQALDRLQDKKETRVGVGKMTAGLDPNALTSHTGAQQLNQVMSAAQQKIQLIARIFAETGVKELFRALYEEIRTHQTKADIVKLRGNFVEVRPFDFIDRQDMMVTVGIGNGNKDQQALLLQQIGQVVQQVGNSPAGYLIKPDNIYNLTAEFIKNSGYKNVDKFITNPANVPAPESKPDPQMIAAEAAKIEAEAEAKKDAAEAQYKQAQMQLDQSKLQLEREKFEWQKKVEAAEAMMESDQKRPVGIGDGK